MADERALLVPPPDPFNPDALRLDQNFTEGASVKKLLTSVPVRKPNDQEFVRVHSDPAYPLTVALIVMRSDRETYVVPSTLAAELSSEVQPYCLYTTINRLGVLQLWPVKLPNSDGRQFEWHRSAAEAAELAMSRWIRVKANM